MNSKNPPPDGYRNNQYGNAMTRNRRNTGPNGTQHPPPNQNYDTRNNQPFRRNNPKSSANNKAYNNEQLRKNPQRGQTNEQTRNPRYAANRNDDNNDAIYDRRGYTVDHPENRYNQGFHKNSYQSHQEFKNQSQSRDDYEEDRNGEYRRFNQGPEDYDRDSRSGLPPVREQQGRIPKGNQGQIPMGKRGQKSIGKQEIIPIGNQGEIYRDQQGRLCYPDDRNQLPDIRSPKMQNNRRPIDPRSTNFVPERVEYNEQYKVYENRSNGNGERALDDGYDNGDQKFDQGQGFGYDDEQDVRRGDENYKDANEWYDDQEAMEDDNIELDNDNNRHDRDYWEETRGYVQHGRGINRDRPSEVQKNYNRGIQERNDRNTKRRRDEIIRESGQNKDILHVDNDNEIVEKDSKSSEGLDDEGQEAFKEFLVISQRLLVRNKAYSEAADTTKAEIDQLEMKNKQLEVRLQNFDRQKKVSSERILLAEQKFGEFEAIRITKEAEKYETSLEIMKQKNASKIEKQKIQLLKNQLRDCNLENSELRLQIMEETKEVNESTQRKNIEAKREMEIQLRELNQQIRELRKDNAYKKRTLTVISKDMVNNLYSW